MPQDLLVRLYNLPADIPEEEALRVGGLDVRRALPIDRHIVVGYVRDTFLEMWASECEGAFSRQPPSCFIAVHEKEVVAFACYNATCWGFFGPLGVSEGFRRRGIGTVLLRKCLSAMWNEGYAYAVIGWVEDEGVPFYQRVVGATVIADSHPGIYRRMVRG
jgi:GNAT superfamily N-acetyltransferase